LSFRYRDFGACLALDPYSLDILSDIPFPRHRLLDVLRITEVGSLCLELKNEEIGLVNYAFVAGF